VQTDKALRPAARGRRGAEHGVSKDRKRDRWLVSVVLAFLAGGLAALLLVDLLAARGPAAHAQTAGDVRLGARGLFAGAMRISRERDALYLVDTDSQVICFYGYDPSARRCSLLAVRSFLYDRKLTDFNNDETTSPTQIRTLVERLKGRQEEPSPD
jgi:hypothetical protein